MVGKDVQCVGIDHDRALCTPDLPDESDGRALAHADAGTDTQGVEIVGIDAVGEVGLLTVHLQHGLGHADLHHGVIALGRMYRYLSAARAKASFGGQHRGAGHAVASGNDQGVPHRALVGKVGAWDEAFAHVALFDHAVCCIGVVDVLGAQTDVEHAQSTDVLLTIGQ